MCVTSTRELSVGVADSQLKIKELESEVLSQADTVHRLETNLEKSQRASECSRQKLYRSSKKTEAAVKENEDMHTRLEGLEELFSAKIASLEDKMVAMQEDLDLAHMECDDLKDRLQQLESNRVSTKQNQKMYLDGVRHCCMDLLAMNVGVK